MRYRYRNANEMKDSGVEWIGNIPKSWDTIKGKHLFQNRKLKNSGKIDNVLSLTLNGVIDRDINNFEGLQPESFDGYQEFNRENLVFKLIDLENISTSRVGYLDKQGLMSPAYIRLEKKKKINTKYYYYNYFDYYNQNIYNFLGSVGVRSALNSTDLLEMDIVNLNKVDQDKIAKFLDEKTAQFDSIISKKEALIQKLEEAKKSLISEVVTGKVKVVKTSDGYELVERKKEEMKDSGVEWLGNIPNDWTVKKLKYMASINPSKTEVRKFTSENIDVSFVPMEGLRLGYINLGLNKKINEVIDGYTYFKDNDIIMAKVTPCFENRNIAICDNLTNGIGFGSSEIYTIRCFNKENISLLFYNLQEEKFMKLATSQMTGAGGLKRVPSEFIFNSQFAIPKTTESILIVNYLEEKLKNIKSLIDNTKKQIGIIKEAKQSLISEAVTGKIEILE